MSKWTREQLKAISEDGKNIIVSAGAGSGKTAVLSQRVIDKIEKGYHINELLILTFTKAASSEMKDRIRKKLSSDKKYANEVNLIGSSYITTFDSFALSIIKKYHYIFNIPSDIEITDESIVKIQEKKIIDDIFEELYATNDNFKDMISIYCTKNDNIFRNDILKIANLINNKMDYDKYLKYIKDDFFNNDNLSSVINDYYDYLESKREVVRVELNNISLYFDSKVIDNFYKNLNGILLCDIEKLYEYKNFNLPRISKYPNKESKAIRDNLKKSLDELISYSEYGSKDEILNNILNSKKIIITITEIVDNYIDRINKYKKDNNIFTFYDISYMLIKLLKENKNIKDEIKYSFKEIMIDEYQDTNDIQEEFVKLIENNNVYMVGDIKQSIYRFRGSNPNIFKEKYDSYSNNNGGYKIDLLKNFRSRSEVLKSINDIFELLMNNEIGGANYKESHEMVYGNTLYDELKYDDYNAIIYEYNNESDYSNSEVEIFKIASDIKEKVNSHYMVFDKNTSSLRNCNYSDFAIILDRSKYFNLYKKIFEYLGIPLSVLKDDSLNNNYDILLIKNIFDFIVRINNNDYSNQFKYDFISIARSFLYEYSDEYIYNVFDKNSFKETSLFNDFNNIDSYMSKTIPQIFDDIIDVTKIYEKINKIGEYENINNRLKTLYEISVNMNKMGYSLEDFINYLNSIIENGIDIKYSMYISNTNSVKLMTIHKSKGLEYPICYFADLDHKFNVSDIKDSFIVSDKYGIILSKEKTILKDIFKYQYLVDEISEKIRLFYVALTRAREKIIIVVPHKEVSRLEKGIDGCISAIRRINFKKYSDLVYSIKDYLPDYFIDFDLDSISLTKKYLYKKSIPSIESNNELDFNVSEVNISSNILDNKHYSKNEIIIRNSKENDLLEYGTRVHEVLEYIDFNNFSENEIEDSFIRNKIIQLLKNDIFKNIKDGKIYKEFEFSFEEGVNSYCGIIDLMVEYDDHIDIIDYKLKNIDSLDYINQLKGYKRYIEGKTNKKINIYLISILDNEIIQIK